MELQPLGDRLVVRPGSGEEVTSSGLVLPDTAQEKPLRGTVLAAGEGRFDSGTRIPMDVAVGDVVVYGKYAGTEVKVDGEDLLILRESDVLAKEA